MKIDGFPLDVFVNSSNESSVSVMSKFGWYERKGSAKNATIADNEKIVEVSNDDMPAIPLMGVRYRIYNNSQKCVS